MVQVDNDDTGSNVDEAVESQVDVVAAAADVAGYRLLHTVVEVDNSVDTDDMVVGAADKEDIRLAVAADHCFCMLLQ